MNVSDAINYFATGTYTVTRKDRGDYVNGDAVEDTTPSVLTIRALIIPATGKELQRLPEGMRQREVVTVFTSAELFSQTDAMHPDVITYLGSQYEVQNVTRWLELGGFFKAVASRIGS